MNPNRIAALFFLPLLASASPDTAGIVDKVQKAHHVTSWWGKEIVRAQVAIDFGGQTVVDGTFTFEAHGPKARYDRRDGVTIIFDGTTAWVSPAETEAPMGRFHVLTWPWFILAPFKIEGEGIQLSEPGIREVDGTGYLTVLQTFGENVGDTPDDWYRFFVNPESGLVDMMSYIVTYGTDLEKAEEQPSIIRYFDYSKGSDPRLSTRYEFWYWNPDQRSFVGSGPKGTGTVSDISYPSPSADLFAVPDNARELPLP